MLSRRTIISLTITALLPYTCGSVKADESISRTTTTTTTEPVVSETIQTPGSVVYLYKAPVAPLVTTIESRRKNLKVAIDQAVASGQISSSQAKAMKAELNRIEQQTVSNTISYPVAVMLAKDVDLIGTQYRTIVTTAPAYVPIISGSQFTIVTGQTYKLDDFSMRRAGLETTIINDLLAGRLTSSRAAELRNQLANIGSEANVYTSDGGFDAKESRHLYDAFDHVASEIDKSAGKDKN